MKILILSSCYPRPKNMNHGIFVHQQAKALSKLGIQVHVIQPVIWFPPFGLHRLHIYWKTGYKQLRNTFTEFEGITIHHPRIFIKMPSRWFKENGWDREGRQVANYILKKPDLRDSDLIFAQFLIHEGYVGTIVKEKTGIPLASIALGDDVHAWPEKNPSLTHYIRKTIFNSDILFSNSKQLACDTLKFVDGDPKVKIYPIYRGVNFKKFRPVSSHLIKGKRRKLFNLNPRKNYLLCVATPVVLKGWIELLDSFSDIKNDISNWELIIVSPPKKGPNTIDLKHEVKIRNIENRVIFLGTVNPSNMPLLMQAVNAFVLPSYNEGISNAVLEALASGLPVITTSVGGHSEVIKNNKNGILVQSKDTFDLKKKMKKVLSDSSLRYSLGLNARKSIKSIGSYEYNARKLIGIINSSLKKHYR